MQFRKSFFNTMPLILLLFVTACETSFFTPWESPSPGSESAIFTISFDPGKSEKALVDLINDARKSIKVSLYGFNNPVIAEAIVEAWRYRNVDVDMITEFDSEKEGSWQTMISEHIPVHLRNTSGIMHNKYFVVDEKYIVTGSTNLTEGMAKHFNNLIIINSEDLAKDYLRDFEVLANGISATEKDDVYNEVFGDNKWPESKYQIGGYEVQAFFTPYRKTFPSYKYDVGGQDYFYFNNDKGLYEVANYDNALNVILPLLENAQKSITIYTFAFTDRVIMDRLIQAYKRGVDVKIFMDYKMFRSAFRYDGASYLALTQQIKNVKICRKADGGLLHHKVIFIDDYYLILGSLNFSNNAVTKNDENFLLISNADSLIRAFEQEKVKIDKYSYYVPETDQFSGYFDENEDPDFGSY